MGSSSPLCIRCATIVLFWPLHRPCAQESAQAKSLAEGPVQALNPAAKPQGLGVSWDLFPHPRHIGPLFSSREICKTVPTERASVGPRFMPSLAGPQLSLAPPSNPCQPLLGTAHRHQLPLGSGDSSSP